MQLPEDRTGWSRPMVGRWWGSAWSCTQWETALAWYPSASWCLLEPLSNLEPVRPRQVARHQRRGTISRSVSSHNRQIVTLFSHNTQQVRYLYLEKVQLYKENPHGSRFQPLECIRGTRLPIVEWKLISNYAVNISLWTLENFSKLNDMLQLTVGSEFRVTETKIIRILILEMSQK